LYYGEEIGMRGKKPDEFIREPFLWDTNEKDMGRAKWVKPRYSNDSTVTPAAQQIKDSNSLLNYYKSFIVVRNNSNALTFGELKPVDLGIKEVGVFERSYGDENLLVLHNLSKSAVTINLPENLKGYNKVIFKTKSSDVKNNTVQLAGYSTLVLRK
jgi:glycosidase